MESLDKNTSYWCAFEKRVSQQGDKTFLVDGATGDSLSYIQTKQKAENVACWLVSQGVSKNTVVSWQLPTSIDAVILMLALSRVGAVQAPVIHLYRERELGEVLRQTMATVLFVPDNQEYVKTAEQALLQLDSSLARPKVQRFSLSLVPQVTADLPDKPESGHSVRWCYFTSGTTSRPKGAKHTDHSLLSASRFCAERLQVSENDVACIAFPIAHIGGATETAKTFLAGGATVLLQQFVPAEAVAIFQKYGVTIGGGSTAHYQGLLNEQRKNTGRILPAMRIFSGGGAAKPTALYYQVKEEMGVPITHAYGMTEAPYCAWNGPDDTDDQLANTDGLIMPSLDLRIVDTFGNDIAPGQSGEIIIKGPNVCQGYLDEQQTKDAFDDQGYFHTGDLGLVRPDGHVCVTGRLKDVIIRKGENISAREVEELIAEHPKVKDVAVIGLPDESRGEMVCAVVEPVSLADRLQFDEMIAFLKTKKLMRQKLPERLEIVEKMPRNQALNKVLKNELQKIFSQ